MNLLLTVTPGFECQCSKTFLVQLHQVEQLPDAEVHCYALLTSTSPSQMATPGGDRAGVGIYGIFARGQAGVGHSCKTLSSDLAGVCWLRDFH